MVEEEQSRADDSAGEGGEEDSAVIVAIEGRWLPMVLRAFSRRCLELNRDHAYHPPHPPHLDVSVAVRERVQLL